MAIKGARANDRSVTPHLLVRSAEQALDFYKRAFGAKELFRSKLPYGDGLHIHMRIGETMVMLTDEMPPNEENDGHFQVNLGSPQTLCGTSVVLEVLVDDVDAAYQKAVDAGGKASMPVSDTFWGDRYGWITDPFGHIWGLATVKEELTPEQIAARMAACSPRQACDVNS